MLEGSSRDASSVHELNRFGAPKSSPEPENYRCAHEALISKRQFVQPTGRSGGGDLLPPCLKHDAVSASMYAVVCVF